MPTATEEYTCLSGDLCDGEAVESTTFPGIYRFCRKHQDQLDYIRGGIKQKNFEMSAQNKSQVTERFCETPDCPNRPVYGGDYCADCQGDD